MKIKLIVIALICFASCHSRPESDLSAGLEDKTASAERTSPDAPVERRLVKDGSLEFKTDDWKRTKQHIRILCDSLGAYSADESLSKLSDRVLYTQVIRVPSARFDDLVDGVEKLAGSLELKSIKVDDVTREFIDLEIRIKNKKEMEARYREMLKQANTVDEMLKIERHIAEVRTEIERMEAGFKNMADRVAFSTIDLSYYESVATDYGFNSKFTTSLSNGWRNLLVIVIGLANVWPFLFLCAGAVFWIKRRAIRTVATLDTK